MQPVPVSGPDHGRLRFFVRTLIDLQLATIVRSLVPALRTLRDPVLDVGAGRSPWRNWLPEHTHYVGLDLIDEESFGMQRPRPEVVLYSGETFPFADGIFESAICIEVLEHVPSPATLLTEIRRVLKLGGSLLLTVPWSARVHFAPHDYQRFTKEGLTLMLVSNGLEVKEITERGSDISVIANKMLIQNIDLFRGSSGLFSPAQWLLGVLLEPLTSTFLLTAHIADWAGWGPPNDPLGYFVRAPKV